MNRVLLAIGCDQYDVESVDNLSGAESDAAAMFKKLVTEEKGFFDKSLSKLLLSPTLEDIKVAFKESLFSGQNIDCLTIYYAGHGSVKDGVYYLTARDSDHQKLSVSGLSTSSIFSIINEARCGHTNIIIDSCESAGVVNDIGSLLKPEIIGKENAISVSILAASASTQPASEVDGQGICTKAILECIDGKFEVFSQKSTLDLNDLGRIVTKEVSHSSEQKPEYWGISLKGHVPFCRNPSITVSDANEDFSGKSHISVKFRDLLGDEIDQIWQQYFALNEKFESREFLNLLRNCVCKLEDYPIEAIGFIKSVSSSFLQKMSSNYSYFEQAEVLGVAITSIMRLAHNVEVDSYILDSSKEIVFLVNKAISQLNENMSENEFYLLTPGYGEYYFLPMRISKILGWIGASIHISSELEIEQNIDEIKLLTNLLIKDYSLSLFAVSDGQTPYLACFVSGAFSIDMKEESEIITCLMFNSFLKVRGRIASTDIEPEQIIEYLLSTNNESVVELDEGALARPSELLSLFFVLYKAHGISNELEKYLSELDHLSLNIFIPSNYRMFGEERIRDGENYTSQIGNGIWVYADFEERWKTVLDHIVNVNDLGSEAILYGSIISSLIENNRVPWFLCANLSTPNPT